MVVGYFCSMNDLIYLRYSYKTDVFLMYLATSIKYNKSIF